jgi:cation transport ATPase
MIPLDGKIISGETTVDEAYYRRTHPKDKRPGAILFAGTLNKMVLLKWKLLPSLSIPPLLK